MKTITCNSCKMQYDATNLQPGVQFKCTQCGSMVQVRGGAPRPGAKRPRGAVPAGGPPQRAHAQQQPTQGMPYGPPPRSKNNVGAIIAVVVGVFVVLAVVIGLVVNLGARDQQRQAAEREMLARQAEQRQRLQGIDEERRQQSQELGAPLAAARAMGPQIEAAMRANDRTTLDSLFDWQVYHDYNLARIREDQRFMNSPLLAKGTWEKGDDGRYTGRWLAEGPHDTQSLRERVLGYIEEYLFHSAGASWDREKSNAETANFSLNVNNTNYVGVRIFIDVQGAPRTKEFWVGAPRGTSEARILNYVDGNARKALQDAEAFNPRAVERDPFREGYDPSSRGALGDPRGDVDAEGRRVEAGAGLPDVAKTDAKPTLPPLVNAVSDLERGLALNNMRVQRIRTEGSAVEKKAAMGAMIDLLIDAHRNGNRHAMFNISKALYDVWNPFASAYGFPREDVVYLIDFEGQSTSQLPIRRWLLIYDEYNAN
jgi:hypothetical protein